MRQFSRQTRGQKLAKTPIFLCYSSEEWAGLARASHCSPAIDTVRYFVFYCSEDFCLRQIPMRFTHTRLTQRNLYSEMVGVQLLIALQRRAEAAERWFDDFILWRLQAAAA